MKNYLKDGSIKDINEILRRHNSKLIDYEYADEDEIYDSIVGHTKELLTNRSATGFSGYVQLIQTDSKNSSSLERIKKLMNGELHGGQNESLRNFHRSQDKIPKNSIYGIQGSDLNPYNRRQKLISDLEKVQYMPDTEETRLYAKSIVNELYGQTALHLQEETDRDIKFWLGNNNRLKEI